jgi:hypothetical protein
MAVDTRLYDAVKVEACLNAGMLLFQMCVAVAFFWRKRAAPHLVIALLLAAVVLTIIDCMMFASATRPVTDIEDFKDVVGPLVRAYIWIPYFLLSRRVQATFTF